MVQVRTIVPPGGAVLADRAGDVVALTRLATGPRAVDAILGWLARRTGGAVTLLGVDGTTVAVPPDQPRLRPAVLATAATAVADMHRRGTPSAGLG